MKKKLLILLGLCFISFSTFSFEGIEKISKTEDGYTFILYQVDISKRESRKCYEFYVQIGFEDSEEAFTWCFNKLNKAMTFFKQLEETEVVAGLNPNNTLDLRRPWRTYSYDATVRGVFTYYWIDGRTYGIYGKHGNW